MRRNFLAAVLFLAAFLVIATPPARAQVDQQQTVNHAMATIERLRSDQRWKTSFDPWLARARAVLIVPDLYKAGFVIGGQFGNGVLLVRGPDGKFSYPGFYALSGGSVGLQIGAEDVSIAFLIMSDNGLNAVLQNKFKIGGEMQVAVLVVGGGEEVNTTTNMNADIRAYALGAVGLFGSLSLEGAVITPRDSWNQAYYGQPVAARDVVMKNAATNPEADRLRDFLAH
jgi:lipid-binding SYLF domain-containing protein